MSWQIASRVHHHVIRSFLERGFAPSIEELAGAVGCMRDEVVRALTALHDGHGLVLHPGSHAIWIAHPFAAAPTGVWVETDERGWWAPCMWCAAGIVALSPRAATIHARLGGERDAIAISVRDGRAAADVLVHFAIPPRDAWNNVIHWCSTVQPFRSEPDVDAWCDRHRIARGELVPFDRVLELGRLWYGNHLAIDWRKLTVAEAQQIFARSGLTGPFWQLPGGDASF